MTIFTVLGALLGGATFLVGIFNARCWLAAMVTLFGTAMFDLSFEAQAVATMVAIWVAALSSSSLIDPG